MSTEVLASSTSLHQYDLPLTSGHLISGDYDYSDTCPVALAVNDVLKDGYRAYVDGWTLEIQGENGYFYYGYLSDRVGGIVDLNAQGVLVEPTTITVTLPKEVVSM